jgi:hypothetical protein
VSQEHEARGHGTFTAALMEGLVGKADLVRKGVITTAQLDAWLSERVKEMTHGARHLVMIRPPTVPDFPMFVAGRCGPEVA